MAIKLIVADDQEVVRSGLATLLAEEDIEIVAEAATGSEAVKKTKKRKPQVVLLDVRMPNVEGLKALEQIRKSVPTTKVIMMSAYDNPSYIARSVALGAEDFLPKDSSAETFIATINRVVRGESPPADSLFCRMRAILTERRDPVQDDVPLTKREYQTVRHLAYGLSNREISYSMEINIETVKEHVQNVLHKLNAPDRTAAGVWAVKRGLV